MEDQEKLEKFSGRLLEYFQMSGFRYLALERDGISIRLSRGGGTGGGLVRSVHALSTDSRGSAVEQIVATSIGHVGVPPGRDTFPRLGEAVAIGSPLFALQRFRDVIEINARTAGRLISIMVKEGDLVEFAQPLATIGQDRESPKCSGS